MRRVAVGLACALVLLSLLACDTNNPAKPAAKTAPPPPGNICERIRPTLAGDWKAEEFNGALHAPPADRCTLTDTSQPGHTIQVSVSVVPVSMAEAAEARRLDEAQLTGYAATKTVDGGVGAGSWAWNPAAAAPRLAFLTGNRLIRVAAEHFRNGGADQLTAIAQAITALPGGIPAAPAVVERPECARGTAAAEHLLGTKAVIRRDAIIDGYLFCQWGTPARAVQTRAGGIASDSQLTFESIKSLGTKLPNEAHRVSVGAEGWQQNDGVLAFRTSNQTFVSIMVAPFSTMQPIPVAELAQAIAPAYER